MNKRILLGIGFCTLFIVVSAQAADRGFSNARLFYFGGGVGDSHFLELSDLAVESDINTSVSVDDSAVGGEVFAGFSITNYLAVEANITRYGKYQIKERTTSGASVFNTKFSGDMWSAGAMLKVSIPASDTIDIYGKLGALSWASELDESTKEYVNGVYVGTDSASTDADGVAGFLALGSEFRVSDNYALYVEYKYLDSQFDEPGLSSDQPVEGIFAGFKYYIGGSKKVSESAKRRSITACDDEFKDVAGVACDRKR